MMNQRNHILAPLFVTVFLGIVAFVWSQLHSVTTPLQFLSALNPKNTPIAEVTKTIDRPLTTVEVKTPDAWKSSIFSTPRSLELPSGFQISVFASGFEKARLLAVNDKGVLHVTDMRAGTVTALPDEDGDGSADRLLTVAQGLDQPHGIVFSEGDLFIAETGRILRLHDNNNDMIMDEETVLVANLPTGGNHVTRTLVIRDRMLYVSVGSSCNVCEDNPRRAAILRFQLDGSNEELFASGLRNAVGVTVHPATGALWVTENGRDFLGDDLPAEEVNTVEEGAHFGWPYCYGNRETDLRYGRSEFCAETVPPVLSMQAHSAPLGLHFYSGDQFPIEDREKLFIAFHGSWNRREPTGYKIVEADPLSGGVVYDFARGWFVGGKAWGRPVDVTTGSDGALYISDDSANAIYRVTFTQPEPIYTTL